MKGKYLLITLVIAGIICGLAIYCFTQIGITPTDTKIVEVLYENEEKLLSVEGVIGAGIARDENNHIVGIAVYVEDDMTDAQKIQSELDGFKVFIKRYREASEFEKEKMIVPKREPTPTEEETPLPPPTKLLPAYSLNITFPSKPLTIRKGESATLPVAVKSWVDDEPVRIRLDTFYHFNQLESLSSRTRIFPFLY